MGYEHEMPALTDEKRGNLVNWLIGQRDACDELHGEGCTDERCVTSKIALAALTAEPEYNTSNAEDINLDVSKAAYDRCSPMHRWISYEVPPVPVMKEISLPEPYDDGHGNLWLPKAAVTSAIRAAGYEVKE